MDGRTADMSFLMGLASSVLLAWIEDLEVRRGTWHEQGGVSWLYFYLSGKAVNFSAGFSLKWWVEVEFPT